ncbi:MAG: CmcI family methyltransferase, partial [Pseudomonadota bacterium]
MIKNYKTDAKTSLTLKNNSEELIVDLYSQEGFEMLSNLWIKVSTEFKIMYELKWLGRPIIQYGNDMVMLQQLIWDVKPDIFRLLLSYIYGGK